MMAYGGDLAKWINEVQVICVINEIPPHTLWKCPTTPRTLFMTTALHFDIYTNFYIVMHYIFSWRFLCVNKRRFSLKMLD